MTQVIVINDTGAQIAVAGTITLDGINNVPPIEKIRTGSLVNLYAYAASAHTATPTALAETATAPTSGNFAYLASENTVKIGVTFDQFQILVLDVVLKDELIRT